MEYIPHLKNPRVKGQVVYALQYKFLPWLLQVVLEDNVKPCDIAKQPHIRQAFDKSRPFKDQKRAIEVAVTSGSYAHINDVTFLYKLIK